VPQQLEQRSIFVITDPVALQQVRDSWQTVRESEQTAGLTMVKAFLSGLPAGTAPAELFWGLLLIFAYSVLEDALLELRDQGTFASKKSNLKELMDRSKSALPWVDFCLADEGREKRNGVAHRRLRCDAATCKKYIDHVEVELKNWTILL
jgi:hypothetical protein